MIEFGLVMEKKPLKEMIILAISAHFAAGNDFVCKLPPLERKKNLFINKFLTLGYCLRTGRVVLYR